MPSSFRLLPHQFNALRDLICDDLKPIVMTNHALNVEQKMFVALRFLATGSEYFNIGDSEHVSKSTVTRCVNIFVNATIKRLDNIKFPEGELANRNMAVKFFNYSKGKNGALPG